MPASLSRSQRRYCTTKRELLAAVQFVTVTFRNYLTLEDESIIRTDHGSYTSLKQKVWYVGGSSYCPSSILWFSTTKACGMVMLMHFPGPLPENVVGKIFQNVTLLLMCSVAWINGLLGHSKGEELPGVLSCESVDSESQIKDVHAKDSSMGWSVNDLVKSWWWHCCFHQSQKVCSRWESSSDSHHVRQERR